MSAFFCLFFPRGASLTWPRRVEIFCTFKQFNWKYFDPFPTFLSSTSFSKSKLLLSLLASEVWTSSCELGSHGEIRIHVWSAMVELPCYLVRYWVDVWAKHWRNTSPEFPRMCGKSRVRDATLGWSQQCACPTSPVLRTGSVGHLSKSPTPISKFSSKLGKIGPKKMFWGVVLPPVTSFSPGASFSQWTSQ